MIRTLAVLGVLLVAAGMGWPLDASAQTSAQGQAVGILFLLSASRTGAQATAKTSGQKPKPGLAASPAVSILRPLELPDRSHAKHN